MANTSFWAAGVLAALLPLSPANAETVFLGAIGQGAVPGTVFSGDTGTASIGVLGVWMEPTASGDTRVEVTLPEYVEINGAPVAKAWSILYARQRSQTLFGSDGNYPLQFDVDYACGVPGLDIDPTTGEMYAIVGRTGGDPGTGDCDNGNRYLAKYNPTLGKFQWIGAPGRINGIEFLPDGTLLAMSASNGPSGRGAISELNKTTGAATFRVRPAVGNYFRDLVYNPGDSMLYSIERCYIIRINPADWSFTSENRNELCNLRRTSSSLLTDNEFIVRMDSGLYKLVVNPSDGTFVSLSYYAAGNNWPHYPMITSKTDIASVAKSCSVTGSRSISCTFGSVDPRGVVVVDVPMKYSVPADALPGVREGKVTWSRGATQLSSQGLNLRVLAPDVEVAMTPSSGQYAVNDTFALTVDVTAVGGKDVDDITLDVAIPSSVLTVTSIAGTGTCGLSRQGVRCTGITLAADQTKTVTINVRADADGYALVRAKSTAAAGDVDSSNDAATSTFVVGTATDLVATGTKGGAGKIGTAMDLEIEVTNEGPDAAVNSVLTLPGDAGFDVGTATTDMGTCAASGKGVRCVFGTMAVDTTATVNVKVTPTRSGNLTFPAAATSDVLDVTPGNNTYPFAVSVPTLPFTIAIGDAQPSSSRGDVRSVLQFAVTPDAKAETGVEISSISGSLKISTDGLALKQRVLVFSDVDANGVYDETDPFVGSGSLSADDNSFTVTFAKPITAPAKKTATFILAVQAQGAPRVAGMPFGTSSNDWMMLGLAALLPLAFAGFAFGRRRTGLAALGLVAIALVGACSEDKDVVASAKVSATITSVSASLLGDTGSNVEATGLPLTGSTVTLAR